METTSFYFPDATSNADLQFSGITILFYETIAYLSQILRNQFIFLCDLESPICAVYSKISRRSVRDFHYHCALSTNYFKQTIVIIFYKSRIQVIVSCLPFWLFDIPVPEKQIIIFTNNVSRTFWESRKMLKEISENYSCTAGSAANEGVITDWTCNQSIETSFPHKFRFEHCTRIKVSYSVQADSIFMWSRLYGRLHISPLHLRWIKWAYAELDIILSVASCLVNTVTDSTVWQRISKSN